jgi:hypothetical protein
MELEILKKQLHEENLQEDKETCNLLEDAHPDNSCKESAPLEETICIN